MIRKVVGEREINLRNTCWNSTLYTLILITLYIHVRYKQKNPVTNLQTLVFNGDCDKMSTMMLGTKPSGNSLTLLTNLNEEKNIAERRVSYKKQELLTLREHLGSPPVFFVGVHVGYLFSFMCCVLCVFVLFLMCPTLPVSLDCPFLIAPSFYPSGYSKSFVSLFSIFLKCIFLVPASYKTPIALLI
jgi:hypothetical protein